MRRLWSCCTVSGFFWLFGKWFVKEASQLSKLIFSDMNDITLLALCVIENEIHPGFVLYKAHLHLCYTSAPYCWVHHNLTSDILSFSSFDPLFGIFEKSKYLNILMIWIIRFVGNLNSSSNFELFKHCDSFKCWSPIWFRDLVDSIVSSTEKNRNASKECVGRHFVLEAQKVRIWIRSYSGELFLDWKLIQISMNYGGKGDLRS